MDKHAFEYTYSPRQQEEVARIRQAYLPKEEDKMERLRRLHAIPTQKARAASLTVGILGTLILGTGMSICMTGIAAALGSLAMVLGILTGLAGMVLVALAYPVYNRVLHRNRTRIAPEILKLTDELLK